MNRQIPFLRSPIVLAPIAGPGTPELTAAVADAGAFAFLASPYSAPDAIRRDVERIRELTDKPFGINLFVESELQQIEDDVLHQADARLDTYRDELGIAHHERPARPPAHYREQIEAVLEARPQAFSFTFGIPDAGTIAALKEAGIYTIGTATSVEEARALEEAGIDAVCAQGAEAGGHRGSFLNDGANVLIGTLALVPQVVDAVTIPVIAAGGIGDGRGVAAVLALGATAAQLGTAFLLAPEAGTSPAYRAALIRASARDTVITKAFSGKAARGIANRVTQELSDESLRAPYPYQNALTRDIRNAAAKQDRAEYLSLWAGQASALAREERAAQIVRRLLIEAREASVQAATALETIPITQG
jgi:nitronate monooxygenase